MQHPSIAVIGAGYVGLTVGAGLSSLGHNITIVDRETHRVAAVNEGRSPIYEAGLDEAIALAIQADRLRATTDIADAVSGADIVYLAVGTPMSDMGHADLADLEMAFDEVVAVAADETIIVIKSTVPVGTYHALLERVAGRVRLVANPEFLRQGTALKDFLEPERIVLGADEQRDAEEIAAIYEPMVRKGAQVLIMSSESAALVKYASNAFLATKLSFANEMADLAEVSGADIAEVLGAVGLDTRIGSRYLSPGPGFGGSCLPKDTAALLAASERFGASSYVVSAATRVNRDRTGIMIDKIARPFDGDLEGKELVVLGVTYKAGTDDLRDSPAVRIIAELHARGAKVTLYDPQGMQQATSLFPWIGTVESLTEAIAVGSSAIILTEWPEFGRLDPMSLALDHLIDLRNMYSPSDFDGATTLYVSVGRRNSVPR